jgi:hypothetical protein
MTYSILIYHFIDKEIEVQITTYLPKVIQLLVAEQGPRSR